MKHLRVCIQYGSGWNTDIFIHLLNKKEEELISMGESEAIKANNLMKKDTHLEHIVPRLILLLETRKLIEKGRLTDEKIARLLQKHWKVARISREEQQKLDLKNELDLKQTMPEGWTFEKGDTLERLKIAGIILVNRV